MVASSMTDTSAETQARYEQLLAALTPGERLGRALALSAFARQLAWAGAERFAGHLGRAAVIERFFLQVYGPSVPVPPVLLERTGGFEGE